MTFPVPLKTFTRPSPFTADPIKDLEDLSTVNCNDVDQQIAKLPSSFRTSLSSSTVTISDAGTLLSKATTPLPRKDRLNNPSLPAIAEEKLVLETTLCSTFPSHARNIPSSIDIPEFPHWATSCRMMYLYVGSRTILPTPTYSGFMADSFVTAPLTIFPNRSPTPFTPVVALMFPKIHCIAPACVTREFVPLRSTTSCLLRTPIFAI